MTSEEEEAEAKKVAEEAEAAEEEQTREQMLSVFETCDSDHKGYLSKDEMRVCLTSMGGVFAQWAGDEFEQLFAEVDQNGDGNIQYDEFVDWLLADEAKKMVEEAELADAVAAAQADAEAFGNSEKDAEAKTAAEEAEVPSVNIPPAHHDDNGDKQKNTILAWPEHEDAVQKPTPRGLFHDLDPEFIKKQVRQALLTAEPYNVFNFYKETGIWQWLAKHPVFENTTLAVIALNAVYIAVDTDWNKDVPLTPMETKSLTESGPFFQFMEHAFCAYFTGEWIIRFMAFKIKSNGRKDGWFVFDSLLVFMMVMETWVLLMVMAASGSKGGSPLGSNTSILRLFRLLRLSRLIRMLRSLPELMILIKGMVTAMTSVVYVMCLLVIITYVFAIAFTQLAVGTPTIGEDFFSNVPLSMYSLLIYATLLDDMAAFYDALRFEMWPLLALSLVFIALAALTVMNMLIGVLCEVVSAVADTERAIILTETVKEKMYTIINSLDSNANNQISYQEFTKIMAMPEALQALEEVDVSATGLVDFAELFFFEDGAGVELTFETFMECVLDLQETNTATVKDVLDLWRKVKSSTNKDVANLKQTLGKLGTKVDVQLKNMEERTQTVEGQISQITREVQKIMRKHVGE